MLSHNRLSIIDLSALGHQPMINEETGDVLALNGEIYNFRELRAELKAQGYAFRSESDTEVLLIAFQKWGIRCLDRVHGMYAFALWSPREDSLYLARDPMGIKPLYVWAVPDGGLAFASEVKAFLHLEAFNPVIDRRSLAQFLEFGFSCDEHGIFEGVRKIAPGSWQRVQNGRVVERHTFFVPPRPDRHSVSRREELVEEAEQVLDEVVAQHLVADVPVGILLSGGLDSSLIAALAARHAPVKTFTMGFAESRVDERPHGRRVAEFIGSEHHELEISPSEITNDLEKSVWFFDDLFADWGMISTRLLYQKCREEGIKVVIAGEGADELFGGYSVFKSTLDDRYRGPHAWRIFQLYRSYAGRRYGGQYGSFARLIRGYLKEPGMDYFQAIRMFEARHQLPNNYVMKVDKASMSVSAEARVPFLDSRVAELAFKLPGELLVSSRDEKIILKDIARRYRLLPAETLRRPKFGAPIAVYWMEDSREFRSFAREQILSREGWVDELGLRTAMVAYFDRNIPGWSFPHAISIFRNLAWRLLLLNLWSKSYLEPSAAN